jgi:hypothetical protein
MEVASCLLVVYHVMNYEIPVVNKCENLWSPVISKLSGKLSMWQAGWRCVVSDFNFSYLWYFCCEYRRRVKIPICAVIQTSFITNCKPLLGPRTFVFYRDVSFCGCGIKCCVVMCVQYRRIYEYPLNSVVLVSNGCNVPVQTSVE